MKRTMSFLLLMISLLAVACSPVSCGTKLFRIAKLATKAGKVTTPVRYTTKNSQQLLRGAHKLKLMKTRIRPVGSFSRGIGGRRISLTDEDGKAIQIFSDKAEYMIDAIDAVNAPDRE